MECITSYLELLNYEHIKDYIFSKTTLKENIFNLKTVIRTINGYLEELSTLSSKYIDGYTIESALEPYITISPELDLEFKDSSEDLFSSQSILSYFDDIHAKLLSMPYPYDFDVTGDLPSYNDNPCLAPRDDFI